MEVNLLTIDWDKETKHYQYKDIENAVMKSPLEFRLTVLKAIEKQLEKDVYNTEDGRRNRDWNNNNFFNPLKQKIKNEIAEKKKAEEENAKFTIALEKDYLIMCIKNQTKPINLWRNGKAGLFGKYFQFIEETKDGKAYLVATMNERAALPPLACGFIAWLIEYWGTDSAQIYSDYLNVRLKEYTDKEGKKANATSRNLKQEFYEQYLPIEENYIRKSEAIFDFISDEEISEIKEFVKCYFEYVKREYAKIQPTTTNNNTVSANDEANAEQSFTTIDVFNWWNKQDTNIFATYSVQQFNGFITGCNLNVYKHSKINAIKYTIYLLSKIEGNEWGEKTAQNTFNCSLGDCQKRTRFNAYRELYQKFRILL